LKELVFTGEMIGATEAYTLGLIEKVVPPGKVMEAALELAARIIEKGPLGVAAAKKVINRARTFLFIKRWSWSPISGPILRLLKI